MKSNTPLLAACLAAFALGACAEETPENQRTSQETLEARQEALEKKSLQRVDTSTAQAVTGEVPETIMETLRSDLAARGVSDAEVELSEATVWPNGAMGCPEPGRMYTQALIEGYRVVFEKAGERWDYRVSSNGGFMLCERKSPLQQRGALPAQ